MPRDNMNIRFDTMRSVNAQQIRAARAFLDWSQEDLAGATNLSIATIRKLELGFTSPRFATTNLIRHVFESAGLEFIDSNGIRYRPEDIIVYQHEQGLADFYENILKILSMTCGELLIVTSSIDALLPSKNLKASQAFRNLLRSNITPSIKCLVTETCNQIDSLQGLECRSLSKHYVDPIPFIVYGTQYATVICNSDPSGKIVVVRSASAAAASRRQFYSMWEKATPLLEGTDVPPKVTKLQAYR
jgi:transcriptional regulator with XRE-family HTH domain